MPCQPKGNGLEMLPSLIYLIGEKQALHLGVYFKITDFFFCLIFMFQFRSSDNREAGLTWELGIVLCFCFIFAHSSSGAGVSRAPLVRSVYLPFRVACCVSGTGGAKGPEISSS